MLLPSLVAAPLPIRQAASFQGIRGAEWGWEVPSPRARIAVQFQNEIGRVWSLVGPEARMISTFRWKPPLPPKVAGSGNATLVLPDVQGNWMAIVPSETDILTVAQIRPFRPLWSRAIHPQYGLPLDWSPDGKILLVEEVGHTRLFSVSGKDEGQLPLRKPFAFLKGAVYGRGKTGIEGYDLRTRRLIRRLRDPEVAPPIGISPDGRWLVAGSHVSGKYVYRIWGMR